MPSDYARSWTLYQLYTGAGNTTLTLTVPAINNVSHVLTLCKIKLIDRAGTGTVQTGALFWGANQIVDDLLATAASGVLNTDSMDWEGEYGVPESQNCGAQIFVPTGMFASIIVQGHDI